jgi:hypothetical protein
MFSWRLSSVIQMFRNVPSKKSLIPQITLPKNPQGRPKHGQCAFQYEYRSMSRIHQGVGTHAFSCRFAFR